MIRTSITREELSVAIKPLCDLLGTSPKNFYASPGLTVAEDEIVFYVPVRHEEDPTGRARGERSLTGAGPFVHPQGLEDAPSVPIGDDPSFAELAYRVSVEVEVL